jgi:hypothetical protein
MEYRIDVWAGDGTDHGGFSEGSVDIDPARSTSLDPSNLTLGMIKR